MLLEIATPPLVNVWSVCLIQQERIVNYVFLVGVYNIVLWHFYGATNVPDYFGNALVLPKGDCKPCNCFPPGTVEGNNDVSTCDQTTGFCTCKAYVTGRNCNQCENGYYNIESWNGCQSCNCDSVGSWNQTCDVTTGQCYCRTGVTG